MLNAQSLSTPRSQDMADVCEAIKGSRPVIWMGVDPGSVAGDFTSFKRFAAAEICKWFDVPFEFVEMPPPLPHAHFEDLRNFFDHLPHLLNGAN